MNPARISAPTLVDADELDPSAPITALKDLVERLPGTVYLKLPKMGHYLNIGKPKAFTEAVVRFIEEHPPRS
jgi:pimeloyl-ACP methyl ester carboxylesterase